MFGAFMQSQVLILKFENSQNAFGSETAQLTLRESNVSMQI